MPDKDGAPTVGDIRAAIAGLPDEATVFPGWHDGPPGDSDPAVEVFGFRQCPDPVEKTPGLEILVGIAYLDDFEDDEEDDDEDLPSDDEIKTWSIERCREFLELLECAPPPLGDNPHDWQLFVSERCREIELQEEDGVEHPDPDRGVGEKTLDLSKEWRENDGKHAQDLGD